MSFSSTTPTTPISNKSSSYDTDTENDFKPLEISNQQILECLRADESSPQSDLYRRLVASSSSTTNPGAPSNSHLYFPSSSSQPSSSLYSSHHESSSSSSNNAKSSSNTNKTTNTNNRSRINDAGTPTQQTQRRNDPTIASPWAHISSPRPTNNHTNATVTPTPKRMSGFGFGSGGVGSVGSGGDGRNLSKSPHNYHDTLNNTNNNNNNNHALTTMTKNGTHTLPLPTPTSVFEHHHSIPLPSYLADLISSVRFSSLMGLLPQANLAWMSVDEKLYVWAYDNGMGGTGSTSDADWRGELGMVSPTKHYITDGAGAGAGAGDGLSNQAKMEDFCTFTPPSKRHIVSVGLVRPKPGVFKDSVKWCLVVTTDNEAILCAITTNSTSHNTTSTTTNTTNEGGGGSFGSSSLRLIPTRFFISTDSIPMVSIAGTPDGRIFLGGYDGCLYEMHYEGSSLPNNYNSITGKLLAGGKRAFEQAIPSVFTSHYSDSTTSYQPHRKCRKLNHSNKSPVFNTIVPGFVQKLISSGNGPIHDICVDAERGCLYTLTSQGILQTHSISNTTPQHNQNQNHSYYHRSTNGELDVVSSMDLVKMAKTYLNAVTRGQMYPPNSYIRFPGGGSAAALGVGGMNGARSLLKASEKESEQKKQGISSMAGSGGGRVLHPISLHVITKKESKHLTLVAITGAGVRFYLSCLASSDTGSGSGSSSSNMNRQNRNPMGPGKKIFMCHIRSPPLIQEMLMEKENSSIYSRDGSGNKGGTNISISPGYNAIGGRKKPTPNVMASFYRNGTMVLALDGQYADAAVGNDFYGGGSKFQQNLEQAKSKVEGDLILTITPDYAGRIDTNALNSGFNGVPALSTTSPNSISSYDKPVKSVAGGLSESINIPSVSSGSTIMSTLLPGGRVWEIATQCTPDYFNGDEKKRGRMIYERLFWASATPSDSELNIGMVPAYVTPSTDIEKKGNAITTDKTNRGSQSTAIISKNDGLIPSAISLLSNVIIGKKGSEVDFPSNEYSHKWKKKNYRLIESALALSYGSNTYTNSRNLLATHKVSSNSAHMRLPHWLMNPEICPLDEISVHHLLTSYDLPPRDILALNSGGLQFFRKKSLLDQLASALRRGPTHSTPTVQSFFETYGYKEGCAMALSLAVCREGTVGSLLSKRAIQAALAHANHPKLSPFSQPVSATTNNGTGPQFSANSSTVNPKIRLNGQQFEFHASSLHDGLVKLTSRLLRPIWFKPAILVTPSKIKGSPAQVEFLLDEASLEEVRRPLHSLQSLLRNVFTPAVSVVPGVTVTNKNPNDMDIDDGDHNLITRALQFQSQSHSALENNGAITRKELEYHARLMEEKSLHYLYRIVSRTVQMLSLLNLLRRAHDLPSLPEVEWGMLHGLYFQQLVVSSKAQERVQSLLFALVSSSSIDKNGVYNSTVFNNSEADKLALALESQTYLYFSAGDRLTFQGFQAARAALGCPEISVKRTELGTNAGKLLRMAAKHWDSPSLVCGKIMYKNDRATDYFDKAMSSSPVAKAARVLMSIDNVGAVVDVCLVCASNFGGSVKGTAAENDVIVPSGSFNQSSSILPWEVGLYHTGGTQKRLSEYDAKSPHSPSKQPTSPSKMTQPNMSSQAMVISGVDVTPYDARQSCYSIILYHLGELLQASTYRQRQLADSMLSVAASSCDELFQRTLYSYLLIKNHVDTFLRIQSPKLESWLKDEKQDYDLLWRHYLVHGRNQDAAEIMFERATNESNAILLDERIQCLTRAVNSLRSTNNDSTGNSDFMAKNDRVLRHNTTQPLETAQELLEVACLQKRILSAVREHELKPENIFDLEKKLLGVSELYNKYAAPLGLYEICLSILQSCKTNDPSIEILWRSLLSKEMILRSGNPTVRNVLDELRKGTPLEDIDTSGVEESFETGKWITNVKETVIKTGRELYGKGADYAFPLLLLTTKLEELRHTYEMLPSIQQGNLFESNPWPLQCFLDIGIGHSTILESYVNLYEISIHEGLDPNGRVRCLANIGEVLRAWLSSALSNKTTHNTSSLLIGRKGNDTFVQLERALSAGLYSSIDAWKGSLESMIGGDQRKTKQVLSLFTNIQQTLQNEF